VFFTADPAASLAASLADSAITHADPRCQLACAALNAAIGRGLATTGADPGPAMFQAARTGLDQAAALLRERMPDHRPRIDQALADLGTDLDLAAAADPRLCASGPDVLDLTGTQQGFVRVAFRLAFWELRWAPSFQAALVDVANRGGDADTNGAITGALLGARHGAAAIPAAWIQTVEAAPQRIGADYLPGYFRSFLLRVPWRPAADAGDRVP